MISAPKPPQNPLLVKKTDDKTEWQAGLKLFFELSSWLIGPLIIALFLGRFLDEKYQTKPWFFLLVTAIAFIITCIGIVLKAKEFIREIENNQKPEDKKQLLNKKDDKQ